MARQERQVEVDGLRVTLARGGVRRVNLRVRPDGSVRLSVPTRVPNAEAIRFLRERRPWIDACLARQEAARASQEALWANGNTLSVLGEPLVLRVERLEGRRRGTVARVGDDLLVRVPADLSPAEERGLVERLVRSWATTRLREALPDIVDRHAGEMGVSPGELRVRRMTSRWGSCNVRTKAIAINAELALRPLPCLESVVVHELCHLLDPHHDERFHALQDRYDPAWRESRAYLNAHPPVR